MVFSSVFYITVLMVFLLSLFLLFIYWFLEGKNQTRKTLGLISALLVFSLTIFFKPDLKYLPWFLLLLSLIFIRKHKSYSRKFLLLSILLFPLPFLFHHSGVITHPEGNIISNSLIMFGHTDYGGDGGEGAFIYPENKARYENALSEYLKRKKLSIPDKNIVNDFNREEIRNFITKHPDKWILLQLKKIFRTFGIVPEGTSLKILCTGLFKDKLWLSSFVVVVPVALIILLFILFFNYNSLTRRPVDSSLSKTTNPASHFREISDSRSGFFYFYLTVFLYYILAIVFFGQYQERYRIPVIVIFIIPLLGYFMASFDRNTWLKRNTLLVKCSVIVLFLTVWIFQANKALSNRYRLENALKTIENMAY